MALSQANWSSSASWPVPAASAPPVERRAVTFEDVGGSPRHREPEGLGEQQVLRAGSVQHVNSPSPRESWAAGAVLVSRPP